MRLQVALMLLACARLDAAMEGSVQVNSFSSDSGVNDATPAFDFGTSLGSRTQLQVQYSLDAVSAASFNYAQSKSHVNGKRYPGNCFSCHPPADALSGATQNYTETRHALALGVTRKNGAAGWGADVTISRENDYSSDGAALRYEGDAGMRDSTLSLSVHASQDRVGAVTRPSFGDELFTQGVDAGFTQVLSPDTVALLGLGYASFQGYQQSPYAFVQIGADELHPERVAQPRRRERLDATATLKQGLWSGSAMQADYRYYADDWGVLSHTMEFAFSQKLGAFVVGPSLRRTWQPQGAYFFKNAYGSLDEYRSRDLKLSPYSARMAGLTLKGQFSARLGGLLSYSYYLREDSLDYSLYYADKPEAASLIQAVLTYR
jgi:hypothetical protein